MSEPLSPCYCHDVPCKQQWTHSVFWSVEKLKCFQACVAVNAKTGGMFLRITQNGESIPALVALFCADERLFASARWTRTVVFLQSCDRSRCCDLMASHAWLNSKSHPHCVARIRHTFSKLRLQVNIRKNSVHFRKSQVRANKLDVQETDFSFAQFYRS